jgi:hypothetical protein
MLFGYFTLFVALVISAVAEFYSIVGLTSIFAAAFWPVVIMGAALGVGKITAAVWLKLNWDRAKWTYKLYLVPAVVFLMFLTSMGIFGFLSKAHSDQSLVGGDVQAKIAVYDEKIKIAKENIDVNRKALKQMDEAVDQVMGRSTDEKGADKAVAVRRSQQKERGRLLAEIETYQKTVSVLAEERAPIAAEVRKVEAEVGPIKYIAAMIYGDNPDGNLLEAAVRWVIILIVAVFDPLALMLILAAQQSLRWGQEEKIAQQELDRELENDPEVAAFFERSQEVARALDQDEPVPEADTESPMEEKSILEQHPYLSKPFASFDVKPMVAKTEVVEKVEEPDEPICCYKCNTPMVDAAGIGWFCANKECNVIDVGETEEPAYEADDGALSEEVIEQIKELSKEYLPAGETITKTELFPPAVHEPVLDIRKKYVPPPPEALPPPVKEVVVVPETVDYKKNITVDTGLTADNDSIGGNEVKAQFGINFPDLPDKGELYLRVDYLPSRLFKYNGSKWIEVDKSMTDSYVYDAEYIKFLIAEIEAGHVDPDELSQSERDQITEYLSSNEQSRNAT